MPEHKPWADRLNDEVEAFFRLWKNRRWLAIVFIVVVLVVCATSIFGWLQRGYKIDDLKSKNLEMSSTNKELNRDIRQLESENKSLRETVAPLIARAAKEFPGEEINTSLKKIINRLEKENPLLKPIASATATVQVTIKSDDKVNAHFIDSGGGVAFGKGSVALLQASSHESWGTQSGTGEVIYRGVFSMPADADAVGKPIEFLKGAEYIQAEFAQMPTDSIILNGKAIFVINDSIRLEFSIPKQQSVGKSVFIRDLTDGMKPLTQYDHPTSQLTRPE